MFLYYKNYGEGVLKDDTDTLGFGSTRISVDVQGDTRKCVKTNTSFHNEELEVKLKHL